MFAELKIIELIYNEQIDEAEKMINDLYPQELKHFKNVVGAAYSKAAIHQRIKEVDVFSAITIVSLICDENHQAAADFAKQMFDEDLRKLFDVFRKAFIVVENTIYAKSHDEIVFSMFSTFCEETFGRTPIRTDSRDEDNFKIFKAGYDKS